MTTPTQAPDDMQKLKKCPFCGLKPQWGLTKKTGCQMHGDPIQYITISCGNRKCAAKPSITGGNRYSNGETGEFFKRGDERARSVAGEKWNTRADMIEARPADECELIEIMKDMAIAHRMSHTHMCDGGYWRDEFDRLSEKSLAAYRASKEEKR